MKNIETLAIVADPDISKWPADIGRHGSGEVVLATQGASASFRGLTTRKKKLSQIVQRQKALETLMSTGTVIPFLPGQTFTKRTLDDFVEVNRPLIQKLSGQFENTVQFQVSISWTEEDAKRKFQWTSDAELALGIRQLSATMIGHLEEYSQDRHDLPLEPEMLINSVILIQRDRETDLDQALAKIDAIWPEGLKIRLVGPSPPVSFASLTLKEVDLKALDTARTLLGIAHDADADTIASARRKRIMNSSEEERTDIVDAAAICMAASRATSVPFAIADIWSEGRSATAVQAKASA